eukprot:TRINITY_DN1112_c0_g1_i1.p1 TRINITY_DN1112_c0_g1~~TRINITY_DN1112_c0_g1_i1.p1  ORF type:complete len:204 (-),score=32.39 TRINITY_DN1112_c0_g1_i1:188-799(-)
MSKEDVYEGLSFSNLTSPAYEAELKELKSKLNACEKLIVEKDAKISRLQIQSATLAKNISVLFVTAKSEIERKDRIITSLQKEVDEYAMHSRGLQYKEKEKMINIDNLTDKERGRLLSSNREQPLSASSSLDKTIFCPPQTPFIDETVASVQLTRTNKSARRNREAEWQAQRDRERERSSVFVQEQESQPEASLPRSHSRRKS